MTSKPPHSFSCENDLFEEFQIACANNITTPSMRLRQFIIEYLRKNGFKVEETKLNKKKKELKI